MSIIEAAGLTAEEAEALVAAFEPDLLDSYTAWGSAAYKLAQVVHAELEATRPLKPGDFITIPWQQERYELVCIDGDECWAKDSDGDHLTLALDTCERIQ